MNEMKGNGYCIINNAINKQKSTQVKTDSSLDGRALDHTENLQILLESAKQ